jgi:hypothetical protein
MTTDNLLIAFALAGLVVAPTWTAWTVRKLARSIDEVLALTRTIGTAEANRYKSLLEITKANNAALEHLCKIPDKINDPTVKLRMAQAIRDLTDAELGGMPPEVARQVREDIQAELNGAD